MTKAWLTAFALCASTTSLAAKQAAETSLDWAKTFRIDQSPQSQHFVGQWFDGKGQAHRVEVWRQGESLMRRDTDDRLSIFANQTWSESQGTPRVRYEVVDHRRKLFYEVDRENLNRLGAFYEWDQLAHAIFPPRGHYMLFKADVGDSEIAKNTCTWFEVTQTGTATRLCWSAKLSLPLAEKTRRGDGPWKNAWTIQTANEEVHLKDVTFTPGDYTRFDANEELSPGSD